MAHRVVLAPDKFKGSLTAHDAAQAMSVGIRRGDPTLTPVQCPVADGGEGTLDTVVAAGFDRIPVVATGPTGQPVRTAYARSGSTAVIEMAEVCGLQRLPAGRPAPMTASSHGLGEVMAQALDDGCRDIIIGIGGSASTDGGAGFLGGLGATLRDRHGSRLDPRGQCLMDAAGLDLSSLHARIASATITVAVDVDNPLYGSSGAAHVYGPQKGATPAQVADLDRALRHWADTVERETRTDCRDAAGAGAAGGVGFAALAVLGARMRPGIEVLAERVGLDEHIRGARAVVTGEGSFDHQSLHGKAALGVSRRAGAHGVPAYVIAGVSALTRDEVSAAGLAGVYSLSELQPDRERCIRDAAELLACASERLARELRRGRPPRATG